ncbi:TetR/AcrR family transcriptional regulator [Antribacter gilvus]|uniref:TetR/AcrR family transcriptional regulator n=1 Tax=Antribacter gilvus TaxID=2304675 RepID=UPI000F7B9496|nr:TetR/AcrR family transcriptional regulator [Antribacter gilvus]
MVAPGGPHDDDSTRTRVVAAAARLTCADGWSKVTMGRLAAEAGVSRQTVYNVVGSRSELAEAMVLTEVAHFVLRVVEAFDTHPRDLDAAVRTAVLAVLELARENALLRAIVSATHGADTELLPLLTTHAEPLLSTVKTIVAQRVLAYPTGLGTAHAAVAVDVVVRTVLSHVMQPTGTPAETADAVAWLVGRILAREPVSSR